MADNYLCRVCRKTPAATKNLCYRTHFNEEAERCEMAGEPIPEDLVAQGPINKGTDPAVPVEGQDFAVCPQCTRSVKLTRLGYFEPHDMTLKGGDRCPVSGVRAKHARRTDDVLLPGDQPASPQPAVTAQMEMEATPGAEGPLPGNSEIDWSDVGDLKHLPKDELEEKEEAEEQAEREFLALPAGSSASTGESSPESGTTSTPSPQPTESPDSTSSDAPQLPGPDESVYAPSHLGVQLSATVSQPGNPFLQPPPWVEPPLVILQPPEYEGPVKGEPMSDLAKEIATKVKETFYAYSNRKTSDNRSAQVTLGPSEIGTPCDRRLAMALLGVPAVNPGGDGWAAFVGTCTHVGMAEVYTFADAGTGRYAVELPVFLGIPTVPRGTTDLLDRRDGTVVDWKVMGKYSLDKFKREGPSETYRTQAHTYGYGAERAGERVRNVAVVGLPRAGSSLDEMHVWTEKYDKKLAVAALARVEKIAAELGTMNQWAGLDVPAGNMRKAESFQTGDDCRYCPFFLKGDREMERGCPGQ